MVDLLRVCAILRKFNYMKQYHIAKLLVQLIWLVSCTLAGRPVLKNLLDRFVPNLLWTLLIWYRFAPGITFIHIFTPSPFKVQ